MAADQKYWRRRWIIGFGLISGLAGGCRTTGNKSSLADAGYSSADIPAVATLVRQYPRTYNAQKIPGDVVNLAFFGSKSQLINAFIAAGWAIPEPLNVYSSIDIAVAVVFNRPYATAPLSNLYLFNRIEDQAFEFDLNNSPVSRHHIRFWQSLATNDNDSPIWLGAATFDASAGVSLDGGFHFTHEISSNIDTERDYIVSDLSSQGLARSLFTVRGLGPQADLDSADGQRMITDGNVAVVSVESVPDSSPPAAAFPNVSNPLTDDAARRLISNCVAQLQSAPSTSCNPNQ